MKWYRKAAERASAQFLADMYANGKGVMEDDQEAVKWYRKAAELECSCTGNPEKCTHRRRGSARRQAVKWNRKAAERERNLQFNLGIAYANGKGC